MILKLNSVAKNHPRFSLLLLWDSQELPIARGCFWQPPCPLMLHIHTLCR